jgi:hypothetical protein
VPVHGKGNLGQAAIGRAIPGKVFVENHALTCRLIPAPGCFRPLEIGHQSGFPVVLLKFPVPSKKFPVTRKKFPVPLRREFACNPLSLLADCERESWRRGPKSINSLLISLVIRELKLLGKSKNRAIVGKRDRGRIKVGI